VLVAGGCVVDGCTRATDSAVVLDRTTRRSSSTMFGPRDAHTATRLDDGTVLVVGGFAAEGEPALATAELFDPGRAQWVRVGSVATGRGGHAAALLGDGRVLVAGGWTGPGRYTASTELFDPRTATFTAGPALPAPVNSVAAVGLADGSVLVTGGQTDPTTATADATLVRPDGHAVATGPLLHPRFKHTMVRLPGGEVLVIGGTSDDEVLLDSTEIYDPVRGTFRDGPRLQEARYKLSGSATLLPDGRVLVAGGGLGVEVVDPVRGASTLVTAAGTGWSSFSTVSVLGDTARVLGGYDRRIGLTGTDLRLSLADL
jgi:hypothetical protein